MEELSRIEAIEIACEILVGDEDERDNDFIFALTEEEKSLILRYRTKLHDYIKQGVFDEI